MSRLSMILDQLIEDRSMDRARFAERLVNLGWEENTENVMKVLEDRVTPCHDIFWGSEEVLSLNSAELQKLKEAGYKDAGERAARQKASIPGAYLAMAIALALALIFC